MYKMEKIIQHLNTIENWRNDESFLIDAVFLSSAKLLLKCKEEVESNSVVSIAPILRQVQENIVVIIGLVEGVYTMQDFIKEKHNPKGIMDAAKQKNPKTEQIKVGLFDDYLFGIKEMLNKFSHTNFEGVMASFTERFQVPEALKFNRVMMKVVISLLERPFIVMVNQNYELNIELPSVENLQKDLKEIGTMKYVFKHFPASTQEFINRSEALQNYYKDVISEMKKIVKKFNELKPI